MYRIFVYCLVSRYSIQIQISCGLPCLHSEHVMKLYRLGGFWAPANYFLVSQTFQLFNTFLLYIVHALHLITFVFQLCLRQQIFVLFSLSLCWEVKHSLQAQYYVQNICALMYIQCTSRNQSQRV